MYANSVLEVHLRFFDAAAVGRAGGADLARLARRPRNSHSLLSRPTSQP